MERDSKGKFVKGMKVTFTETHRRHLSEAAIGNTNSRSYKYKGLTLKQIYGEKKAEEIKSKNCLAHLGRKSFRKGLTLEQEHGPERAREIKKKMSESDKGRKNPYKGLTHEQIFGQEKAEEMSKKNSEWHLKATGENSCHWKGGITSESHLIRTSKRYQEWRLAVFQRDNYTCQKCGQRGGNLEAHHLLSFREFPELRFELWNSETLCSICHSEVDEYRKLNKVTMQQGS